MKGNTLSIILLVVGLVVGAGAGYYLAPSGDGGEGGTGEPTTVVKAPLEGKTIQLGYISSTTTGLETSVPHIEEMMTPDYNEFAEKIGYDIDFEYLIDDATGQAAIHLEKVQGYKSMDVNIFIGGGWSSQAQAALSYCNDNDMLMWSASSTSPLLAISDDNLYRMCPTDLVQAPAISEMLWSHGIKAIVVIQRGDAWADGIYNILEPEFQDRGGVILERIRYAAQVTEFSNYLQTAEEVVAEAVEEYGEEHVGVEIISFAEFVTMMTQAQDYPTLYSLKWFGSDGTTLSQQACDDAPEQATNLRVYSTYAAPADSEKFNDLYDRYYELVGMPYGYYTACTYDIGWLLAQTILEAQSTSALDVIPLQMRAAFNHYGASGWTRLNEDGDRYASNYQIWSYHMVDGECQPYVAGLYNGVTEQVTWYTEEIGYTPPTH
ncbi:ABC transporter substrate-binding protein [Candidatus Bathyarchaeota archaeon]|nr:ABC transporter substrate-binding protein [Candidatus Bathyarchaeota archaeon]